MPMKEELLARAQKPAEGSRRLHAFYKGKIQTFPKCPIRSLDDFAVWCTPGVAVPCRDIQATPGLVYGLTNRANSIAVVSDGTRVLGLGDIGPETGSPVMEGKALLFKYLGGVDAVPICLGTKDPQEIVRTVKLLEPSFDGINLKDIAMPKCFRVLEDALRVCSIPVWHDGQQGTATVLLAALINALKIVGKPIGNVRIVMIGMGTANVPTYRFLKAKGAEIARLWLVTSKAFSELTAETIGTILNSPNNGRSASKRTERAAGVGFLRRFEERTSVSPFRREELSSRSGSRPWPGMPLCLPAPTRSRRSGHGKRRKQGLGLWRPAEVIFPTKSTIP